jgi:RNA polymerase sigma-70 factor (ECF subfamily)
VSATTYTVPMVQALICLDPEADLVALAAQGDAEAFGMLYARHLHDLYRYFRFRVGDDHEAEDLTETAFLRAWEALPTYRLGEFSFRAWLYRVARNLVADHWRSRRDVHALTDEAAASMGLEDPRPRPEDILLAEEQKQSLEDALSQLRPDHQQILALRFVGGLSHAEAAEVLGTSPGAVRVLQHRALKALSAGLVRAEA